MNPKPPSPNTPATPSKLCAPRLSGWIIITLVLLACVWVVAPHQLPVSLYKLSLVTLASVVGYWIDRSLFPYARPDKVPGVDGLPGMAMIRRAIIVGCAMLAMGLGA